MKNILILTSVASMVEQFNMSNIKILQELDYKVYVATNFDNPGTITKQKSENFKVVLNNKNVDYINLPINRNPLSTKNIDAFIFLKKYIKENNISVVHAHSPVGGMLARLLKISNRKLKVIYTAHGLHFYKGSSMFNWLLYFPIEWVLSFFTDFLITINNEDFDIVKKTFPKRTKKFIISGTGVKKYNKKNGITKESFGFRKEDYLMVFGAELNKNKNQILLLKAMKILLEKYPDIKLLLVGKDNNDGQYQEFAQSSKLSNVYFMGYRDDIREIISVSDLAVSSSIREGLGVFVIEAISQGLPVIATNNRGSREIVINDFNGYLIDNSPQQLVKYIERIYLDDNLQKRFSNNSLRIFERFDEDKVNKQMKDIYLELK